jgi:tRNA U34 2-thiouridine synthase MnmA/TrmU
VPASVVGRLDGFELRLRDPVHGVARGQFAVLYEDDAVVGAGAITKVS